MRWIDEEEIEESDLGGDWAEWRVSERVKGMERYEERRAWKRECVMYRFANSLCGVIWYVC